MNDILSLPGGELVSQGLADSQAGLITPAACLIAIAHGRLLRAGLPIPPEKKISHPEEQLYALLSNQPGDAYSRYNSLVRQLISFSQALEAENFRSWR